MSMQHWLIPKWLSIIFGKKWCKTVGVRFETMMSLIHGRKSKGTLSCIGMGILNVTEVNKIKAIATQRDEARQICLVSWFLSKLGRIAGQSQRVGKSRRNNNGRFTLPKVMICAEDVVRRWQHQACLGSRSFGL